MDWTFNTILFDKLDTDIVYQKDLKKNDINWPNQNLENSEYAILWHLKANEKILGQISKSDKLKFLQLNWANITDFEIISERFTKLKRLELQYCTKLFNDYHLEILSESLQNLHILKSKKFVFSNNLIALKNLKILRLNDCAPIENLDFLHELPNLEDFRFVNTNIISGNLNPILEHSKIKSVGFLNKRHYNIKDVQIEKLIQEKYRK
jgi:hypothetical protein